jgi:hypothetical protein
VALKSFTFGVVESGTRVQRDDVGRFYIRVSTCVGAVTRGVVVCRCSGQYVGKSRIRADQTVEHGRESDSVEGLSGNQSVLSGSLRGLQNLKDQRRRVVRYLALVHAGCVVREEEGCVQLLRRCSSVDGLECVTSTLRDYIQVLRWDRAALVSTCGGARKSMGFLMDISCCRMVARTSSLCIR